ncbi:MAG: 4-oxalocrotonate tautomerase DmpI [Bacillota bacterium]|nr:4-oxalocrotonate tautomerase DmpI [Bacillota bacterium]
MPIITIEGPEISREQKVELVKGVCELLTRVYKLPEDTINTIIKENNPDNLGHGAKLISDLRAGK